MRLHALPTAATSSVRPAAEYRAQSRGGKGVRGMTTREEDYVESVFTASTHDFLLFFTSRGQVYVRKGYQIPEAGRSARGTNIVNILPLEPEREDHRDAPRHGPAGGQFHHVLSRRTASRSACRSSSCSNVRKNGIRALDIREGDELVTVRLTTHGSEKLLVVTRDGMAIRFDENDVPSDGPHGRAVCAASVSSDGDEVVAAVRATDEDAAVLTVTENGYGKRTPHRRIQQCRTAAVRASRPTRSRRKTGEIVGREEGHRRGGYPARHRDDGTIIRMEAGGISLLGRATQGVRLMRPAEGAHVVAMARTEREASEEETAEPGESAVEITEE